MRLFLFLTVKHSIAMMKALPEMFPSPVAPPKKLGHASEAMLHILQVRTMWMYESFSHYFTIQYKEWIVVVIFVFLFVFVSVCRRPQHLSSGETTLQPCCDCLWNQLHTMPVLTFPKEDIYASVMYLMACYYVFHLTYPKCIATLLSMLQTEVLSDAIHERDMTSSYKKAMAEWKKFITE